MTDRDQAVFHARVIREAAGFITYPVGRSLFFKLAKLTYRVFEDESYEYVFEPYYDVLDGMDRHVDIPGVDLDLRKPLYIRRNLTPVFITDRTFPKNRVDARKLLKERNLDYYDPMAWLTDSPYTYTGDDLSLKSEDFYAKLDRIQDSTNLHIHILHVLQRLGCREDFRIGDIVADAANRTTLIRIYLHQYRMIEATYYAKIAAKAGRKRIVTPIVLLAEIVHLYENRVIGVEEAMRRLNLTSKSTFYRRLREYRVHQRQDA